MEQLERALADLEANNYGSAIRTLELITGRDPTNSRAYKHLSRAYFASGDLNKAVEASERYTALEPSDANGHYNVGVIFARLGRPGAAGLALKAALDVDPAHAKARRALHKVHQSEPIDAAPAARPAAKPAEGDRESSPWPARIAAIGTLVAAVAIIAALFLPGGPANPGKAETTTEESPHETMTPPAGTPSATDANFVQQPQYIPQTQAQTPPTQTPPAPEPDPQPQTPGTVVPPAPSPQDEQMRRVYEHNQRLLQQQIQQMYAQYQAQQEQLAAERSARTNAEARAAKAGSQQTQGSGPSATQPGQGQQPSPQPQTQAPPQPKPGLQQQTPKTLRQTPQQNTQPAELPPLLTPQEANQVVKNLDGIEREQLRQGIFYSANALRASYLQDPEVWGFVCDSLPLMVASTSPSLGAFELTDIITRARSGAEAADMLERYTYDIPSVLPGPVQRQIAAALANARTPEQAWQQTDGVLRQSGVSTTQATAQYLERTLIQAQQRQARQQTQ